jgi:hypothetical protein
MYYELLLLLYTMCPIQREKYIFKKDVATRCVYIISHTVHNNRLGNKAVGRFITRGGKFGTALPQKEKREREREGGRESLAWLGLTWCVRELRM